MKPNGNRTLNDGFRNVILLGLVSFFADISSEMVYPLIPLYLTAAFGATPVLVGIIEGIAESAASLLKVFGGYITDRRGRKKAVAWAGYSTGLIYKLALLAAGSWGGILAARVIDRIGKGIRTAPRDALVSESAESGGMGRAFGVHKALDMAGSAIGIAVAYLLLQGLPSDTVGFKRIFAISIIPAAIALAVMFRVREKPRTEPPGKRERFWLQARGLDSNLKLYLVVSFLFTLGNSSNAFLLLRAKGMGFTDANVILLYLLYNLSAAVLSIPFGRLSDKSGRKNVLVAGYVIFAIVYFGFAFASSRAALIGLFALYGVHTAMVAGVERAFIAELAPARMKGTLLGLQATVVGVTLMPASILAGLLWNTSGASAPFIFGGAMAVVAAALLLFGLKNRKNLNTAQ